MSLCEFLGLRRENEAAYHLYLKHISSRNKLFASLIHVAFFVSLMPFTLQLPVIGNLLRAIQNLFIGYIVECKFEPKEPASLKYSSNLEILVPEESYIYDYVIIGSGPGAAIAATKIAPGKSVLIIEQGTFPKTSTSKHHTLEHVRNDFYKQGQELVLSPWMAQFTQAATLGGGSEVNSGLYHQLPPHFLDSFTDNCHVNVNEYLASELKVRDFLKVEEMSVNENLSLIVRGATGSGMEYANIPRWRHYRKDGTFVHHGMNQLLWFEKISNGSMKFLLNSKVLAIDNSDQRVLKIKLSSTQNSIESVLSRNVILSAGTIQTPYILCKSGILKWSDTRFQWHPMVRTMVHGEETDLGLFDVDPFQCWTKDKKFKIGSAVSTPGLMAMNLGRIPVNDELTTLRSLYISFVSSGRGGLIPHTEIPWYLPSQLDKEKLRQSRAILESFIESSDAKFANKKEKVKPGVSSVHIFGSVPINSKTYESGTARLAKDTRIQISDASILPFGPGVNPQGVVMAICDALVRGD
jgi:hypothetical protein